MLNYDWSQPCTTTTSPIILQFSCNIAFAPKFIIYLELQKATAVNMFWNLVTFTVSLTFLNNKYEFHFLNISQSSLSWNAIRYEMNALFERWFFVFTSRVYICTSTTSNIFFIGMLNQYDQFTDQQVVMSTESSTVAITYDLFFIYDVNLYIWVLHMCIIIVKVTIFK